MKRLDELLIPTLSAACRNNAALSPEQRKTNNKWLVELRKQVDRARLMPAGKTTTKQEAFDGNRD